MARQDTVDFLTAFAVGTVLGIGATLLLTPERTHVERMARRLGPYRKQMRKSFAQAREAVRGGGEATGELLADFRHEVSGILDDARKELQTMVNEQLREVSRPPRRRSRPRAGI